MLRALSSVRLILVLAFASVLPGAVLAQTAPDPGAQTELTWQPIGTLRVDASEGRGEYRLRTPLPVRAVRLVARDAVTVSAVVVTYETGRIHLEERRIDLVATDRTRPIAPTEGEQKVAHIEVFGRPKTEAASDGVVLIEALAAPGAASRSAHNSNLYRGSRGLDPSVLRKSAIGLGLLCVDAADCSLVPVLFGTNRTIARDGLRVTLGPDRSDELKLGRAFVTVPRRGRTVGTVPLPSTLGSLLTGTDPKRHFTMPAGAINIFDSDEAFLAAAREELAKVSRTIDGKAQRHAFVFVHGYRVTFENAAFRAAQIAFDLAPDGQPFATAYMYSWPSGGGAADYVYDQDSSRLAIPSLTRFLQLVIDETDATHVHVIAHSMGNFPLIQALGQLKGKTRRARINQIILAAPDVDKTEFERIAGAMADFGTGATLYASASDRALLLSRIGRRNTPRAGDVKQPPGPALATGIDTIDVSALSTGMFSWGWNHDTYADSREIINDIALQFRNGPSRPDSRNVNFRPETVGGRTFWRYRD